MPTSIIFTSINGRPEAYVSAFSQEVITQSMTLIINRQHKDLDAFIMPDGENGIICVPGDLVRGTSFMVREFETYEEARKHAQEQVRFLSDITQEPAEIGGQTIVDLMNMMVERS